MSRYAIIDRDGLVENVVVWDGVLYDPDDAPAGWTPPDGLEPVKLADDSPAGPGDRIDRKGNVLEPAPAPAPEPSLEDRVSALEVNRTLTDPAKPVD